MPRFKLNIQRPALPSRQHHQLVLVPANKNTKKGGALLVGILMVLVSIATIIPFFLTNIDVAHGSRDAGPDARTGTTTGVSGFWFETGSSSSSPSEIRTQVVVGTATKLSHHVAPDIKSQEDPLDASRSIDHRDVPPTTSLNPTTFPNNTISSPSLTSSSPLQSPSSVLPYFVIHMGPDKTGTTAIQSFMKQAKNKQLLEQDGYDASFSKGNPERSRRLAIREVLNCFISFKYQKHPCHTRDNFKEAFQKQVDSFVIPTIHQQASSSPTQQQPPNSILWSTEAFRWANFANNSDWPWFLGRIRPHFQRPIRIVVVYRRYFDWIASRYNEDYSGTEYSGTALLRWPDDPKEDTGIFIPTFESYFQQDQTGTCPDARGKGHRDCQNYFANRIRTNPDTGRVEAAHPLLEMIRPLLLLQQKRKDKDLLLSVQVLNFHSESEDLLEAFFCKSIPLVNSRMSRMNNNSTTPADTDHAGAVSRACQEARRTVLATKQQQQEEQDGDELLRPQPQQLEQHAAPSKKIKRQEIKARQTSRQSDLMKVQYDRIAVEAHRLGILPWNVSRSAAKHHVRLYHEQNMTTTSSGRISTSTTDSSLPWVCPSPEVLQVLRETSYRFEQELLQLDVGRDLQFPRSHDDAFQEALAQKKFCHVNVTELLSQDDNFRNYLSTRAVDEQKTKKRNKQKRKGTAK